MNNTENLSSLPAGQTIHKATVISTMFGQALEWYDFYVYGALAAVLAQLFFPTDKPFIGLLSAFALFAVGFFMRPLGALVFGYASDKYGRKAVFVVTLLLMAVSTALVGVLPTYSDVGILAPILLLCLRLLQGLSVGGESTGSIVFLIEHAPQGRKAIISSLILVAGTTGWLLASLISAALNYTLTHDQFYSWGWRIPFLLGILTGVIGLILRLKAKETPIFEKIQETGNISKNPIKEMLLHFKKHAAALFAINSTGTLVNYMLLAYLPVFLNKIGGLPLSSALFLSSMASIVVMILVPFAGWFTDKVGTRLPLLLSTLGICIFAPFMFYWGSLGSLNLAILTMLIGAFLLALYAGPLYPIVGEWFPAPIRATSSSVTNNVCVGLIGGTAPLISTLLVHWTGNNMAPGYYLSAFALLSFLVGLFYGTKTADERNVDTRPPA